jgi:hypothetical protein
MRHHLSFGVADLRREGGGDKIAIRQRRALKRKIPARGRDFSSGKASIRCDRSRP